MLTYPISLFNTTGLTSTERPEHNSSGRLQNHISLIDRSSRPKINTETSELNDTIDQMDKTEIYRIFHPPAAQNIK
jgi:hypothetical protein